MIRDVDWQLLTMEVKRKKKPVEKGNWFFFMASAESAREGRSSGVAGELPGMYVKSL